MIAPICISLVLLAVTAQARLLQGTLSFENDDYFVQVNGNSNVPFYSFYHKLAPDDEYRMQLQKMVEIENGQNVGGSLISLPSLSWTIEEIEGENLAFWINATSATRRGDFEVLSFRNELKERTIKFDFILDGYTWTSNTADSLNLEWKLSNASGTSGDPYTSDENEICYFGGQGTAEDAVCVDIESTAQVTNGAGTVTDIAVTLEESGSSIAVSYDKFDGDLFHDPEFGSKNDIKKKCFLC